MFTLTIIPAATSMVGEAYLWYEKQQIGLGELFLEELDKAFDKLESNPYLFAIIKKKYRQLILGKFPYVLVFEILEKEILIISIYHTGRNPRKKFKK